MGSPKGSLIQRLWRHTNIGPDCWLWTGAVDQSGYGMVSRPKPHKTGTKMFRTHRVSWELFYGEIPEDLCVLHRCDNPRCIRPDHLFLGTRAENNKDRDQKGRWKDHWNE